MSIVNGPQQLSLEVSLRDDATFDNYFFSSSNQVAAQAVQQFSQNLGDQALLIWGGKGDGLTHLLQASSHQANVSGFNIQYIPLHDVLEYTAEEVFDGLEVMDLICLDGIEHICGKRLWEQGLFHFYNRLKDSNKRLLMSSHVSPTELSINLPDLKSRVCGSVVYHIQALSDEDKAKALKMRAALRGMEMPDDVVSFILSRAPRDSNKLFDLLNILDKSSLQQKRKLTIPFVKSLIPA